MLDILLSYYVAMFPDRELPGLEHVSDACREAMLDGASRLMWRSKRFWLCIVVVVAWCLTLWFNWMGSCMFSLLSVLVAVPILHFGTQPVRKDCLEKYIEQAAVNGRLKKCFHCNCDLTGSTSNTCPECGTWIRIDVPPGVYVDD